MTDATKVRELTLRALEDAGVDYGMASAHRVPYAVADERAPYTGNGLERDPSLQGAIEVPWLCLGF